METLRVLLIQPPQTQLLQSRAYISLGLCFLGAVLEQEGVEVSLLNLADVSDLDGVRFPYADWYGVSCVSATYQATKKIVDLLRGRGRVVVGGAHPSVQPNETARDLKPSVTVTGEAEYLFRDLVLGRIKPQPVMHAGIVEDLDALPFPARHLYDEADVVDTSGIHGQEKGVKATTVLTSRGCPYACRFCCKAHPMFWQYRYRSAENVRAELISLQQDYGVEHVRFVDDEFTLNQARTMELMKSIEDLGLTFVLITRADTLSPELLKAMKQAGCAEVHIGIETGSDRLLRLMDKRVTSQTLLKGVRMIKDAGIRVKTYLMYDFPGETEEDRQKTLDWLREAQPDKFTLSRFVPLPGSAIPPQSLGDQWFYPDESDPEYLRYKDKIKQVLGVGS